MTFINKFLAKILFLPFIYLFIPSVNAKPIEVHVVVVTTFEIGHDRGDVAGEFQNWVERFPLETSLPFPENEHGVLRYNEPYHVLGLVTGEGPSRTAASMASLLADKRFDFSHAYFILSGIAGMNPRYGTVPAAVWTEYIVNGSAAYFIDPREMPSSWKDGFIPLQTDTPYEKPRPPIHSIGGNMMYHLNTPFVNWAYSLTKDVKLLDNPKLMNYRKKYQSLLMQKNFSPRVMKGDTISTEIFWIGHFMNNWAERWVDYWTDGRGKMVTTAEEDLAFCQTLKNYSHTGKIDFNRLLILRTSSNFDVPAPGDRAENMLKYEKQEESLIGLNAATKAAYDVAQPVVMEIAQHWNKYKDHLPQKAF